MFGQRGTNIYRDICFVGGPSSEVQLIFQTTPVSTVSKRIQCCDRRSPYGYIGDDGGNNTYRSSGLETRDRWYKIKDSPSFHLPP